MPSVRWAPALYCGLILMGLASFLIDATLIPGRLTIDHWVIADDARQFQAWMHRLTDAEAMKGNLIADYWQSTSPWLYQQPFSLLAKLNVPPRVTGILLTSLLIPVTALFSWNMAGYIDKRAFARLVIAGAAMAAFMHDTAIFSASPRAFAPALTMLFFWSLLKRSTILSIVALFCLALVYPAVAITALGIFCLDRTVLFIMGGPPNRITQPIAIVLGIIVVLAPLLLFRDELAHWGPVMKLSAIGEYPSVSLPRARNSVVQADGTIGWFCSGRMGFVPDFVKCRQHLIDVGGLINAALLLPMLAFGLASLRRDQLQSKDRLYAFAFVSAFTCWACASLMAFALHLPSRYSHHILAPLALIAIAQLFLAVWDAVSASARPRNLMCAIAALCLCAPFVRPHDTLARPEDRLLLVQMSRLPPGSKIGGLANDLDFVPALLGLSVTATVEHAIPYNLGYYRPYRRELEASAKALMSEDPDRLAEYLTSRQLTAIVMDRNMVRSGGLSRSYHRALPALALPSSAPLLGKAPPKCQIYAGRFAYLFDAPCIVRWLNRITPDPRPLADRVRMQLPLQAPFQKPTPVVSNTG